MATLKATVRNPRRLSASVKKYLSHSHSLSELQQSSATANQVIKWDDVLGQWKAGNVDWSEILNKPTSFTPSAHTHPLSDLEQSGATTNQVPKWSGTAWTAGNIDWSEILNRAIDKSGTPQAGQVAFWVDGTNVGGDTGLTYDSVNKLFNVQSGVKLSGGQSLTFTGTTLELGNHPYWQTLFIKPPTVGIGTTNPTAKLHVEGDSDVVQLLVKANATQTQDIFQIQDSGGNPKFIVRDDGASGWTFVFGSSVGDPGQFNIFRHVKIDGAYVLQIKSGAITYLQMRKWNTDDGLLLAQQGNLLLDSSSKWVQIKTPTTPPISTDVNTSHVAFSVDETNNKLKFTVKYSDGTTVKTGEIALV